MGGRVGDRCDQVRRRQMDATRSESGNTCDGESEGRSLVLR